MSYFKSPDGALHFLDNDAFKNLLPSGSVKVTNTEAAALQAVVAPPTGQAIREQRDARLAACDWAVLPDSPLADVKRAEFVTYRQALRDVPGQSGFPDSVVWPEAPK